MYVCMSGIQQSLKFHSLVFRVGGSRLADENNSEGRWLSIETLRVIETAVCRWPTGATLSPCDS